MKGCVNFRKITQPWNNHATYPKNHAKITQPIESNESFPLTRTSLIFNDSSLYAKDSCNHSSPKNDSFTSLALSFYFFVALKCRDEKFQRFESFGNFHILNRNPLP